MSKVGVFWISTLLEGIFNEEALACLQERRDYRVEYEKVPHEEPWGEDLYREERQFALRLKNILEKSLEPTDTIRSKRKRSPSPT